MRGLSVRATARARALADRTRRERDRRRSAVVLGVGVGGAGLVAAVTLTCATGAATALWWLTVPTWVAIATPMLVLVRLHRAADGTAAIATRTAGIADVARVLRQSVEVPPAATGPSGGELRAFESLASIVERDVETATRALRDDGRGAERRRHRRIVPRERRVIVTTSDGRRLRARIADVSLSGVAMAEGLPRLWTVDRVLVGRTPATVARTWERGIAFEFETQLDPLSFGVGMAL